MNGDPNLDLNWLRTQGHPYEPYADWIVELLAQRQALLERNESNREAIDLLSNRCDAYEVEVATLRDELRDARATVPPSSAMGPLPIDLPAYPTYGSDQ